MAKHHKFSHTIVEHHGDGSHTVHHIHEQHGYMPNLPLRDGDVRGAAADHDSMVDHLMDHTSMENPGEDQDEDEEAMEEAIHPGIHKMVKKAQAAGEKA